MCSLSKVIEHNMLNDDDDVVEEEDEENWTETWTDGTDPHTDLSAGVSIINQNIDKEVRRACDDKIPGPSTAGDGGLMSRMVINDNKAGMQGLDKAKINQIILEASKGSKYFENEKKKEEQVNRRIEEQKMKKEKISEQQLKQGQVEADRLLEEFERHRDLSHTIVHIDMDAFYAAVEMREDPTLKNKPMAVGGNAMLSTSNYLARKFGVRAAMPGFIGKKLCPDLVLVPQNFEKYNSVSKDIRDVISDYDPNFCPMSLDEAYLDITEHLLKRRLFQTADRTFLCRHADSVDESVHCLCDLNLTVREKAISQQNKETDKPFVDNILNSGDQIESMKWKEGDLLTDTDDESNTGLGQLCPKCGRQLPEFDIVTFGLSPEETVQELRSRIEQRTRLTASAGIAPNMMLAKVCSDKNKPNGQYRVLPTLQDVIEFIKDLPTRKISGIGKVSEKMLNALGVHTCTHLYQQRALLYHLYSSISFNYFMRICLGIGSVTVERDSERKSISTERTFTELSKPADLYTKCQELCESLCEDLQEEQLRGKTVTIKLKTVQFEVKTRAHTLADYTSDVEVIYTTAKDLLKTEMMAVSPQPLRLRLMGVRMSTLLHESLCRKKQQNTLTKFVQKIKPKHPDSFLSQDSSTIESSAKNTEEEQIFKNEHGVTSVETSNEAKEITRCKENDNVNHCREERNVSQETGFLNAHRLLQTNGNDTGNKTEFVLKEEFKLVQNENVIQKNDEEDLLNNCNIFSCDEMPSAKQTQAGCGVKNENMSREITHDNSTTEGDVDSERADSPINEERVDPRIEVESKPGLQEPSLDFSTCPVCQDVVKCESLSQLNQHIDVCLNRQIVKDCSKCRPEDDEKLGKKSVFKSKLSSPSSKSKSPRSKSKKKLIPKSPLVSKLNNNCIKVADGNNLVTSSSNDKGNEGVSKTCDTTCVAVATTSSQEDHGKLICPVCFMEQTGSSLEEFNSHVDSCLCKGAIAEIIKEQKDTDSERIKRNSSGSSLDQPSVKRKRFNSGIKTKSIESFFKN